MPPASRIPPFQTPSKTADQPSHDEDKGESVATMVDPISRGSLGLDASYLMEVVGENSGDTLRGALETSLLSGDSQNELVCSLLDSSTREGARHEEEDGHDSVPQHQVYEGVGKEEVPFQTPTKDDKPKKEMGNPSIITGSFLSPFSAMLHPHHKSCAARVNGDTESQPNNRQMQSERGDRDSSVTWAPSQTYDDAALSLRPCRKVSVVVNISYQSSNQTKASEEASERIPTSTVNDGQPKRTQQLCLFPYIPTETKSNLKEDEDDGLFPEKSNEASQKNDLSPTSATLNASMNARDLVVVNPSAFGKFIPSEITMQTARLVAQVANIESEDWARIYRFQHVVWPDDKVQSFSRLARAMANDVLVFSSKRKSKRNAQARTNGSGNHHTSTKNDSSTSRVLVATGSSKDKTSVLFGRPKTNGSKKSQLPSTATKRTKIKSFLTQQEILQDFGLIGLIFDSILQDLPHYAVCALSIYEVVKEDKINDLLSPPGSSIKRNVRPNQLQIRQPPDRKGAIVEGLTEFPIDSLESLQDCLKPLLPASLSHMGGTDKQSTGRRMNKNSYQCGHVVVSLKVWQSAVQHDLNLETRCATLTFVNLAVGDPSATADFSRSDACQTSNDLSSPPRNTTSENHLHGRRRQRPSPVVIPSKQSTVSRNAFLRTSVSSLGGVLRGAQLRQAGGETVIPYRNSTLTKVLQRPLDHPECRVVVLASLSPLSNAYDDTLATLRYVERLLVRSGLPKSPFEKRQFKLHTSNKSTPDTSLSASPTIMPSPPSQPQILMEQFAGKESILESVVTDPRQRLARFYRSQQQLSPSESSGEGSAMSWWKGPENASPAETNYMKVDPATIHSNDQQSRAKDESNAPESAGSDIQAFHAPQSTSLAKYIMPPLSPVPKSGNGNGDEVDVSFNSTQQQAAESFESYPGNVLYTAPNRKQGSPDKFEGNAQADELRNAKNDDELSKEEFSKSRIPSLEYPTKTWQRDKQLAEPTEYPRKDPDPDPVAWPKLKPRIARALTAEIEKESDPMTKPFAVQPADEKGEEEALEPIGMYQEPTGKPSSATGFFQELATLENSVDAMRNVHQGIWQTSAASIRHIKGFHMSQENMMNELIAQRDNALDMARKIERENQKLSQKMVDLLKEKDSEIVALQDAVKEARSGRADVEKIAEEAIAAQDSLEHIVSELEQKLSESRHEYEKANAEHSKEALSKAEDLSAANSELFALRSSLREKQATLTELEVQFRNLESDHLQLSRLNADGKDSLKRLTDELKIEKEIHWSEKQELNERNSNLELENQSLQQEQRALELELSGQLARVEEDLQQCRAELEKSTEELTILRKQDQLTCKSMDTERATFRQQIAQLKSSLTAAEGERDKALGEQEKCKNNAEEAVSELERTRDDLGQRIADVEELSMSLQQALEDQENLREELHRKERDLENFQIETRHRINRVLQYRDESASLLDKAAEENFSLVSTNEKLQEALTRVREERDNALRSRDRSRQVLSDVQNSVGKLQEDRRSCKEALQGLTHERDALKSELDLLERERNQLGDMLKEQQTDRQKILRERTKEQEALSALRLQNDKLLRAQTGQDAANPNWSEPENVSGRDGSNKTGWTSERAKPFESFQSSSLRHPPFRPDRGSRSAYAKTTKDDAADGSAVALLPSDLDLDIRAEEIAACIAFSARQGTRHGGQAPISSSKGETQDNFQDGDKELLIAALKRKVKILEKALVFEGQANQEGSRKR